MSGVTFVLPSTVTITVQLKSYGTYFVVSVQNPWHLLEQGGGGLNEVHARYLHVLTVVVLLEVKVQTQQGLGGEHDKNEPVTHAKLKLNASVEFHSCLHQEMKVEN